MTRKRTHLENLLRILPAGVTSKKDIGDLKMAVAILSCNFLDAYRGSVRYLCTETRGLM